MGRALACLAALAVGACGGGNACKKACDRLEQCVKQIPGAQPGECTLDTSNCTGIHRCVADCTLAATCEEIIGAISSTNNYTTCLAACGGQPPADGGGDGAILPDLMNSDAVLPDAPKTPTKDGTVYLDGAPVQPSTGCQDEPSEPNNNSATATAIPGAGLIPGWEICYPGDVDHYLLELGPGQQLQLKIQFSHNQGDLDLALLDPNGLIVATSRSETNDEEISHTAGTGGAYIFAVYGFAGATNSYDIVVSY
jgi:hypothetical protein